MGLDISWYRDIRKVEKERAEQAPDIFRRLYANSHFPSHAGQIEDGAYYYGSERGHFCAGSYRGYNEWREQLAALAGYPKAPHPDGSTAKPHSAGAWTATGGPFWELIYFSDCEGVIGATVAAKLAKDFAAFQPQAGQHEDEWFRDRYSVWRFAFEQAAHNGAVYFH